MLINRDESILIRSGYPLVKPKTPGQLGTLRAITLSIGINKGELLAKFTKPKGTLGITFQITGEQPTDATVWRNEPYSASKFLFTGLTSGKEYWVRVMVVGSGTQVAISPISNMFVV